MNVNYNLYLVTDERTPIGELLSIVEEAVQGGVTIVQLREKNSDGLTFYKKAKHLKALLKSYQVPLIINDRVDIALAVGADGIHVGQDDIPLSALKRIVPKSMIIGVSTQTIEQAQLAEKIGADYIGIGSAFPTKTKQDATVLSMETLKAIKDSVNIPAVAIGGITLDNFHQLKEINFSGIAVVSAIMKAKNPKEAAKKFFQ
ncbi:thiamine-phosphate diphosphorylase [Heyndrickxia sporothermodurans]|uniref:thiamine phosphate synthase n=1 Tax=Heyndrickxia sporothermodurans TaxID=46224 RepID=UPI000D341524|nr:thiamine phosphate synthase [Heyndrickxia sporothermodurans]PTY78929.1 thiamine-phosphate diphosphorylase [Heyndrickxia sporothermodurans]